LFFSINLAFVEVPSVPVSCSLFDISLGLKRMCADMAWKWLELESNPLPFGEIHGCVPSIQKRCEKKYLYVNLRANLPECAVYILYLHKHVPIILLRLEPTSS
jgi:hypothetical protein